MEMTSPEARATGDRLVRSAMQGDRAAFGELVRERERYMYALAMGRLGDEHLARDAVQEALLLAWKNISKLREPRAFHSWLGRIVINATISAGRRHKAEEHAVLDERQDFVEPEGNAEAEEAQARRKQLAGAISELDEERQAILAMHYSEGLSYAEMAARLDISEDAVRGRLFQAREKLRASLGAGS